MDEDSWLWGNGVALVKKRDGDLSKAILDLIKEKGHAPMTMRLPILGTTVTDRSLVPNSLSTFQSHPKRQKIE